VRGAGRVGALLAFTFWVPIWAANAAPVRPANTIPVISAPSLAEHRNPDAVHDEDHCAELPGDEPDLEGDDDAVNPLSKLTLR